VTSRKTDDWTPAYGACRTAAMLSKQLGMHVSVAAVPILAGQGLLTPAGTWKGAQLYDLASIQAFTDAAAAAAASKATERLRKADAIAYLQIRDTDFRHLTSSGMLKPARYVYGPYDRRIPTIPLYAATDLDTLLARTDIDWPAVRATPRGRPSLLLEVAAGERVMAALAAIGGR
jgi:hypothetical protein